MKRKTKPSLAKAITWSVIAIAWVGIYYSSVFHGDTGKGMLILQGVVAVLSTVNAILEWSGYIKEQKKKR